MKRAALCIGEQKYLDLNPLKYAENDAVEVKSFLKNTLNFDEVSSFHSPTSEEILNEIDNMVAGLKEGDLFVFYYAGHGIEFRNDYLLLDIKATDRESDLEAKRHVVALSYLKKITGAERGVQRLFIFDSCRTGLGGRTAVSESSRGGRVIRDLVEKNIQRGELSVIYSTAEGYPAEEIKEIKQGLFTKALLDEMRSRLHTALTFDSDLLEKIRKRMDAIRLQYKFQRSQVPAQYSSANPITIHTAISGEQHQTSPIPDRVGDEKVQNEWKSSLLSMQYVEGGSFQMGSESEEADQDENPVHTVKVDSFYLGTFPVTQDIYREIMHENPSEFSRAADSEQRPVERVSWYEAVIFCNLLSSKEGLTPVYELKESRDPGQWGVMSDVDSFIWDQVKVHWNTAGYRLPTEAEWEYAARGGAKSRGYAYAGSNNPDKTAWYNSASGTCRAAQKQPNELGLYDMSGNVFEWCWDLYGKDYYEKSPADNPYGPEEGTARVIRGGSWSFKEASMRSTGRGNSEPSKRSFDIGFRVLVPAKL